MKKTIIIIIVIIIVGSIILGLINRSNSKPEYVTATVVSGEVVQTVDATGSVASAEEIDLNFRTTGRIAAITVKAGDQVRPGQTLASLEAGALQSRVTDANSALLEADANLEQVLAGATEEDIRVSEITVDQKQQSLESARNDLQNLISSRGIELTNLKNTVVVTLNNELVTAAGAMETVDSTLNNSDAEATLSALNSSKLILAEDSQSQAMIAVDDAEMYINHITLNSSEAEVLSAVTVIENTLNQVRTCLSYVFDVLEATITSSKLTQTKLDTLITNIQTKQIAISTARTSLQIAKSNWTNKQVYYQDQITKAEDNVASAEDSLTLAQAQLDLKKAGPKDYQINAAKAQVERARASLILAQSNLADAVITAPVQGVITKINNKQGEQTSLALPVMQMIGDSNLEIEVDIPESDITKIKVGQDAEITLDAFGDERIFRGKVTFIDPAETVIQDVVYYQVKVQFSDGEEDAKPGMTANVVIETAVKNNVLAAPARAVKRKNGDQIVEVLVNNLIEEKIVTTGLKGDELIEIISGVTEGEEIITFVKNN